MVSGEATHTNFIVFGLTHDLSHSRRARYPVRIIYSYRLYFVLQKVAINQDKDDKDAEDMKTYILYEKMYHERPRVPPNSVRQVKYIPDKNSVISSTSSSNRSLVIANVTSNQSKDMCDKVFKEYVFNIDKVIAINVFMISLNTAFIR